MATPSRSASVCGLFLAGAVVTALLLRRAPVNPLGSKLFGIAVGIAVIALAILAAALHGSRSYDGVARSCLTTARPQVEHYRPGTLNQLINARDCVSIVGR